jgi:hypothetical protein
MILCLRDPKNSFSNAAGYKIYVQKLVTFLHTNKEKAEKGIREAIQFTISSNTTK